MKKYIYKQENATQKAFVPAGFSQHDLKEKRNFRETPTLDTLRN